MLTKQEIYLTFWMGNLLKLNAMFPIEFLIRKHLTPQECIPVGCVPPAL